MPPRAVGWGRDDRDGRQSVAMGCASSTPLVQGASPQGAPPYDLRQAADPGLQDDSVAGKVRQTVTGMADAVPVQDLFDGVSHAKDEAFHKLHVFGVSEIWLNRVTPSTGTIYQDTLWCAWTAKKTYKVLQGAQLVTLWPFT
ncbi:hypothetical protein J6590_047714 [Homalodisca vitripennis]|nr:hypothetical protein J6590_047714 [Homalodisca vitripennis]